jgi:hypothetical protein
MRVLSYGAAWGLQRDVRECSRGAVHHLADGGVLVDGGQELLRLLVLHIDELKPSAHCHLQVYRVIFLMDAWLLRKGGMADAADAAAAEKICRSKKGFSASPCRLARTQRRRHPGRTASC